MDWLHLIFHHFQQNSKLNEILIQGVFPIRLECSKSHSLRANPFKSIDSLISALYHFAEYQNKRLDYRHPFCGGVLSVKNTDYRWHIIIPPIAEKTAVFSLRRQRFHQLSLCNFQIQPFQQRLLKKVFTNPFHIIILGPTGVGKSSLLVVLLESFIPFKRSLVLETLPEIIDHNPHWVSLSEKIADIEGKGQVSLSQLFEQALRLHPEVFIFGEIRSVSEWNIYKQARHTGHSTCTTLHGGSREDIYQRFPDADLKQTTLIHIKKDFKIDIFPAFD